MSAPTWTPGMDAVTGTAAHPSMQRKTTDELWRRLERVQRDLREARSMDAYGSPDWIAYVDGLNELHDAYVLALEWRKASADELGKTKR